MNYFSPKSVAERYASGRPDFHANTIAHIKNHLNIDTLLDKALDVACGTGLSTKALLAIAKNVYGTDTSEEMLKQAFKHPAISYSLSPAEQQPFEENTFDLITVSSGIHWFDIDAFLNEAKRLLKPNGWLVVYDNYFISEMEGNDEFSTWFPNVYKLKFPSPPRNRSYDWSNENLSTKSFKLDLEERFKNAVPFTKEQLILYFTTQSNITQAIEEGIINYTAVEKWLNNELSLFFENNEVNKTIYFGNWVKYLQVLD